MPTGVYTRMKKRNWKWKTTKNHKGSLGYKHTKESKGKIGKFRIGLKHSGETKRKISKAKEGKKRPDISGSRCHLWKGGISFEPYSVDWTDDLKRAIRKRDKYTCQICGKEPAVSVHHIDYNKKNCNPDNLITLCNVCHTKTNHNRKYWINYFQKLCPTKTQ